ncbi:hypothetical protein GDO81_023357 [Engystomops pustulosus]|uniref:Uncharacterized protein n=1 Tax=Engystomops pustulosus TaxID=76066 RepID=A0AAV6YSG9_ENGPU|nr:hypothetical protein GDO81_023357 [Engystomops pustulosus]
MWAMDVHNRCPLRRIIVETNPWKTFQELAKNSLKASEMLHQYLNFTSYISGFSPRELVLLFTNLLFQ